MQRAHGGIDRGGCAEEFGVVQRHGRVAGQGAHQPQLLTRVGARALGVLDLEQPDGAALVDKRHDEVALDAVAHELGALRRVHAAIVEVEHRRHLLLHERRGGRVLDAPTANLTPSRDIALPGIAVYVTRSLINGSESCASVTSVGTNPTFESDHKVRIETLLLDYGGDLYGSHLAVDFLEREPCPIVAVGDSLFVSTNPLRTVNATRSGPCDPGAG